jgi:hypothetical protein
MFMSFATLVLEGKSLQFLSKKVRKRVIISWEESEVGKRWWVAAPTAPLMC